MQATEPLYKLHNYFAWPFGVLHGWDDYNNIIRCNDMAAICYWSVGEEGQVLTMYAARLNQEVISCVIAEANIEHQCQSINWHIVLIGSV